MDISKFIDSKFFEFALSFVALVVFFILREVSRKVILRQEKKHDLDRSRSVYINKFFNFTWLVLLLVAFGFIWNVSFKGLFASFFAIAGVALFANWSILSNATASVILFFNFPFKIGAKIRIMDKDDSVEGVVKDISFFAIIIQTEEGHIASYPNNVAIQKAIIHLNANVDGEELPL
ncbi:Mechanosensitive ion channel [Spirosomataceae bacterium TFI 002]|nr:Mechanosensitive ion channel [Spirosomataceae bacterium TFI 002]